MIEKFGFFNFSNNSSPILKNEKSWIFNFFAMKILSLPVNLQVEKESLHAEEEAAAATLLSRSAVQQFFSVESEFLLSWYVWCSVPFSLRHTVLKNMLASRLQQQQHWSFYSIFWTQALLPREKMLKGYSQLGMNQQVHTQQNSNTLTTSLSSEPTQFLRISFQKLIKKLG